MENQVPTTYSRRMEELTKGQQEHAANVVGSPLMKRSTPQSNDMASAPNQNPDQARAAINQQLADINDSHFGRLHNHYSGDPAYKAFTQSLQDFAFGLRKQVEMGYMPRAIAEERIHEFVQDHRKGFEEGKAHQFSDGFQKGSVMGQVMQEHAARHMAKQQAEQAQQDIPDAVMQKEDNADAPQIQGGAS